MKEIGKRRKSETMFEYKLHGFEVNEMSNEESEDDEITQNTKKEMDKHISDNMASRMEAKVRKYGNKELSNPNIGKHI